jgi:hypothetical protein
MGEHILEVGRRRGLRTSACRIKLIIFSLFKPFVEVSGPAWGFLEEVASAVSIIALQ